MVEKLEVSQETIEKHNKELEKLSIVANKTDNAVIIMDPLGEFEWVNAGFTKIYGYTLDEFKKEKGINLIEGSASKDITSAFEKCIKTKKSVTYESLSITKVGNKVQNIVIPFKINNY